MGNKPSQNKGCVEKLRIVCIGKTGAGKTHTGQTILDNPNVFQTKCSSVSGTQTCESVTGTVNGRTITYVDTPGVFDTKRSEEQVKSELLKSIIQCCPGPHAFLITLKVEIYTDQKEEVVRKILAVFGEEALNYAVVLFTHGDQLDVGQTIEEFVKENPCLQELVNKCGGRCHVIDNKYWNNQRDKNRSNRVQRENLLQTIEEMVREREEEYYINKLLQEVQRNIDSEMQRIRAESNGRVSEEKVREQAEKTVHSSYLVMLKEFTTQALLGDLLGVKQLLQSEVKDVWGKKCTATGSAICSDIFSTIASDISSTIASDISSTIASDISSTIASDISSIISAVASDISSAIYSAESPATTSSHK